MPMNQAQYRVVDPILSTIAQGYTNAELIGNALFPIVPVDKSGGKIISFGKESFQPSDSLRAPGAATKRIDVGYVGLPYALENHGLEALVPIENMREAQVPGIDLAGISIKLTQDKHLLNLEVQQATLARNGVLYDANHKVALAAAAKWSAATSTPLADVQAAKEAIRSTCGRYPNVMVMGAKVFAALQSNPTVTGRFQYTTAASVTTDMLAGFFGVDKVIVGKAVSSTDAGVFSDIWGNDVVLAFVPTAISSIQQPSFAYTYTMRGNPMVKAPYFDNNRESWIYGVHFERAPLLTGMNSGFLIQAAV